MKINRIKSKPSFGRQFFFLRRAGLLAAILTCLMLAPAKPAGGPVVVLEINGMIGGAVKNYVVRGVSYAEEQQAPCLIIAIDTPGGLMDSMKDIATAIINADLPVVVYVYPNGATATSAGFFILMASDIAAMAPDTSTGSAHPVVMGSEQMSDTMKKKTTNYAVKYMEQLVRRRGRNMDIAREAVKESISVTAQEAMSKNVVEIVASSVDDLLDQLDGREIVKGERKVFVVYLDQVEQETIDRLEGEGILSSDDLPAAVKVDATGIDEEFLAILKDSGYEPDENGEVEIEPLGAPESLRLELESRGLLDPGWNEIEIDADRLDDETIELLPGKETLKEKGEKYVLHTTGAARETVPMSLRERFFAIIGNPNIAYILMIVGVYALIFEVTHPGVIVPGVIGVVSLLLAFTAFQVIPINTLGLLLIAAAVVLFILEVKIVSHGLLTIGGVSLMILGSLMLVDSADPAVRISLPIILSVAGVTALFFVVVLAAIIKTHTRRVYTGPQGMIGKTGRVTTALEPEGKVFVNGEIWNARTDDGGNLEKDVRVEVEGIDETFLVVRRKQQ